MNTNYFFEITELWFELLCWQAIIYLSYEEKPHNSGKIGISKDIWDFLFKAPLCVTLLIEIITCKWWYMLLFQDPGDSEWKWTTVLGELETISEGSGHSGPNSSPDGCFYIFIYRKNNCKLLFGKFSFNDICLCPGGWWGCALVTLAVSSAVLKGRCAKYNLCMLLQISETTPLHTTLC